MAFPRLNALSFWLLLFGGVVFYASLFFEPPQAGWTSYAPLSDDAYSPGGGIDAWIMMVHLTSLSSILGAINFVATIHNMRAPGMSWGRLPLFIWSMLVYAYLLILALPSLTAAVTMLLRTATSAPASSTLPPAATRCCGSTCSGSSATPRSTSWSCRPSASSRRSCRCSRASRSSATRRSRSPPWRSPSSARWSGRTTCSQRHADRGTGLLHVLVVHDRGAHRHQDLQLARHALARLDPPQDAAAVRGRLPRAVSDRRHHRA